MDAAFPFLFKIPDQVGFMVISERAILISHGELANCEETAQTVQQILHACRLLKSSNANSEGFESITIQFSNCFYIITKSGNHIYIVKRRPAVAEEESTE